MKASTTREQQFQYVRDQAASGLTQAAWCKEHEINLSTFTQWVTRYRFEMSHQQPSPIQQCISLSGVDVIINPNADPLLVARVLKALYA